MDFDSRPRVGWLKHKASLDETTMNDLFRRQRYLTHQENEITQKLRAILTQQDYLHTYRQIHISRIYTDKRQMNKFQKLLAVQHVRREENPHSPNDTHSHCVVNLSKRSLDDNEQHVLSLGLNFAVPPRETLSLISLLRWRRTYYKGT